MKQRAFFGDFWAKLSAIRVNWRITWYSVVIWLAAIIVGGFVILPWFYLALPLLVFWVTVVYFRKSDKSFKMGLWVSLIWFLVVVALDLLEMMGPYYADPSLYFSDSRNLLKYPLILLTPVIYSLVLERSRYKI